jgi:2-C-methyl-D-erythritol 4-phosphate cytidylyltransferase
MDSVANALSSCPKITEFVYVHDCARPMLESSTLDELYKKTIQKGAAVLARPMNDTVKRIPDYNSNKLEDAYLTENIDRSKLWIMETPQCAMKSWLDNGIEKAIKNNIFATDEISLLELTNKKVTLVDPGYANPKLTTIKDLDYINFLLSNK